jgi:hypothetical protein
LWEETMSFRILLESPVTMVTIPSRVATPIATPTIRRKLRIL